MQYPLCVYTYNFFKKCEQVHWESVFHEFSVIFMAQYKPNPSSTYLSNDFQCIFFKRKMFLLLHLNLFVIPFVDGATYSYIRHIIIIWNRSNFFIICPYCNLAVELWVFLCVIEKMSEERLTFFKWDFPETWTRVWMIFALLKFCLKWHSMKYLL